MTALVAAVVDGRLLVRPTPAGPVLPAAATTEDGPSPEQLGAVWGATTTRALAPVRQWGENPQLTLHVVSVDPVPAGALRLAAADLGRLAHPPSVAAALRDELAVLDGSAPWPARRPDWYRPVWWVGFDGWIDASLTSAGLRRRGLDRPVKVWSLSAVVEVPVEGGSVFAKAVCEHFGAEPTLTAWIGGLAPGRVPAVLVTEPDRGWMLMRAFVGVDGDVRPDAAPAAARTLAELQLASVDRTDELLRCGAPDRTSGPTLRAFTEVTRSGIDLPLLDDDERAAVASLPDWLAGQLDLLDAAGLPPTLVHGDLHTGNYVVDDDAVLLFDWTDAALAHPVLDAVLLARSAGVADPALAEPTLQAWAATWRSAWPDADVDAALTRGPAVFWAYQAVSYDGLSRSQERRSRPDLAGLSARCLRELLHHRDAANGAG